MKKITQPRTNVVFFLETLTSGDKFLYQSRKENGESLPKSNPFAGYIASDDATYIFSADKNRAKSLYAKGDLLEKTILGGHEYVYVLRDPESQMVFYVGKGTDKRALAHFQVGKDGESVINEEGLDKHATIQQLLKAGVEKKDIVRVVARELDNETAHAIESLLIHHHYGFSTLTNSQGGHKSDRYRTKDEWSYNPGFDLVFTADGKVDSTASSSMPPYYVYVLRDPVTSEILYVGKGKGDRALHHFVEAKRRVTSPKLLALKRLLQSHQPRDIIRVVAWACSESTAYFLESFYMRFIVGTEELLNSTSGHYLHRFRAKDDWTARHGFDLPILINPGAPRVELFDLFVGAGLDTLLKEVADAVKKRPRCAHLEFGEPSVQGAGELVINAPLDGKMDIRVTVRYARRFQFQFASGEKDKINWLKKHLAMLNAKDRRGDGNIFFPTAWRGRQNMTSDIGEAARRVELMYDLANLKSFDELRRRPDLQELLDQVDTQSDHC